MPRSQKTGTVVSQTYPGRIVLTLAPPSTPQQGTIDFIAAKQHKMGGEQIGLEVDRQPRTMTLADLSGVSVKVGSATYTGEEWVKVAIELFEALHEQLFAPPAVPTPPDIPAPAATAKKRK
jgi:hypothetical protein